MMADVNIALGVEAKAATKAISTFATKSTKAVEGVSSSFKVLGAVAAGALAFVAGKKLFSALSAVTEAASVQEDAINSLNSALKISGKFTEEASKGFQAFASEIQNATKFGDEAILENAALIQSLGGLEEEGLKKATQAAVDLAAALNIDLKGAALLVGKAATGEVASFKAYGVSIQKAATNAETFENALKALNKKFGGAAAAQILTYSGAMQQLTNIQGDLNEELGFSITKAPGVVGGIKALAIGYQSLITFVKGNQEQISKLITDGFVLLIQTLPKAVKFVRFFAESFFALGAVTADTSGNMLNFIKTMLEFELVNTVINSLADQFKTLAILMLETYSAFLKIAKVIPGASAVMMGLEAAGLDVAAAIKKIQEVSEGIADTLGDDVGKKLADSMGEMGETALTAADDITKSWEPLDLIFTGIEKSATDAANAVIGLTEAAAEGPKKPPSKDKKEGGIVDSVKAGFQAGLATIQESFAANIAEAVAKGLDPSIGVIKTVAEGLGAVFTNGVKAAEQAAVQIFASASEAIGAAFGLEGLGGALSPLFASLTGGPEQVKAQAEAFAAALPQMVENITEGLIVGMPALIDALIESLIVEGGIVRIVDALVRAIPRVGYAIGKSVWEWIVIGAKYLWDQLNYKPQWLVDLQSIFSQFGNNLKGIFTFTTPEWITKWKQSLSVYPPWVKSLIDAVNKAADIVGGNSYQIGGEVGRFTESTKSFFSNLASGGVVPSGFPNDTYPAALTSGELVVPAQTTGNLFSTIDKVSKNDSGDVSTSLLTRIISLLESPQYANATIELDGSVLSNVILSLNRRSERLTA